MKTVAAVSSGTYAPADRGTDQVSDAAPAKSSKRRDRFPELDELTVAGAQRGNRRARRALIERYQRPVVALVARMLRGRADSGLIEDIAQETFLRVFRALPKFDRSGPARLSTWILTIATHRTIDELRRRRLDTRPLESASNLEAGDSADEYARRKMLAAVIDEAVGRLAPEYKAAFILREYHGLEYAEIARALEIDLGTVKSRLSRAKHKLRDALKGIYHND